MPGLVNLFGIESPGLTSSLAIAEVMALRLRELSRLNAPDCAFKRPRDLVAPAPGPR